MESEPASDLSQWTSPPSAEALELTVYFDPLRDGGRSSLYDALEAEYVDRGLRVTHRLRAVESLGRCGQMRRASAEIDPPQAVMAVDASPEINSALGAIWTLAGDTLVTLVPTEIVFATADALHKLGSEPAKLVVHCRRGRGRTDPHGVGGVLEELRRHGIAGATALGRGEGIIAGHRHRLRLASPPDGPMMVTSIDNADVFARAAPALLAQPQVELITAKPIVLCKWRGRRRPPPVTSPDHPAWSQITLYASDTPLRWRREHLELVQELCKQGAPGFTVLRGATGYALDPLRPVRGWFEQRTAPTVTTILDTPDHAAQWLRAIDDVTDDHGLVTHEFVSAYRPM